jgi:hypothetical protein
MEILLGTNAERTRNISHGIIPTFFWILSQGIFPMEKILNS